MKARESEIGEKIKDLGTASCQEALDAEQKAVKERLSLGDDEAVPLSVSYDAGWSTRGSGRSNNSDTGHGAMIGEQTGKCVAFNIKTKRCRICETAERKNVKSESQSQNPLLKMSFLTCLRSKLLCQHLPVNISYVSMFKIFKFIVFLILLPYFIY